MRGGHFSQLQGRHRFGLDTSLFRLGSSQSHGMIVGPFFSPSSLQQEGDKELQCLLASWDPGLCQVAGEACDISRMGEMMVGSPWGDPAVWWPCSFGGLGVGRSPGVAQVVAGLSLSLICKRARSIPQRGVWASCERVEVKGQKRRGSPSFLGCAVRRHMETALQGVCHLAEGAGGPGAGASAEVPTVLIPEGRGLSQWDAI